MPRILFIPDRYMDYRMWSDIPHRIGGRAEVIHFDQHQSIPTAANGEFLELARRLAAGRSFDMVAAAGQAARLAFALAQAGMARSLLLVQPSLDCIPEDVDLDFSNLDETLEPFMPLIGAIQEPDADPGRLREMLLQVVRDSAELDDEPAELALAIAMYSDHAEELFDEWCAAGTAVASGREQPDPPWAEQPWLDQLATLSVPVTAVVSPNGRAIGEAIARRAKDTEVVVGPSTGLAPQVYRARLAAAALRLLDRIH